MFTGIIEEIGLIKHISKQGHAMMIRVQANRILEDIKLGDSISVNGVCLTVTSFDSSSFTLDVMPETFRKTNLHQISNGHKVNLERAMQANGRFGGHIVQGHVDGVGIIKQRFTEENAIVFTIEPEDTAIFQTIINQGSITLDGISLTIAQANAPAFTVSIIPHTLAQTVLQYKHAGDSVNIECDLLGKYVQHLLHFKSTEEHRSIQKPAIDQEFLVKNGFI